MMDEKVPALIFDDVRVEPAAFKVWKAGAAVPLEPKAFEVLLLLIHNRGRVVQKRELLDTVWRDTFVGENALTREIAQLRKALGDDARHARYIETVPTRGYRFTAEVSETEATANGVHAAATNGARDETLKSAPPVERVETHAPPEALHSTQESVPAVEARRGRRWRRLLTPARAGFVLLFCAAAIIGWLGWLGARRGEGTVGVRRLTQVTTSTGLDIFPALSPDGGYVAYSSDRSGEFEVYVRQLAPGGREIRVTTDGGRNFQPAWSPDGQFIAYYSQRRGGLWVVPALGGVARRLTEFGSRPAWSPDGQQIAFQSAGLHDLVGTQGGALPPSTLWLVPARGGAPRQLTKVGEPSGGHGSPVWWPNGGRILFFAYDLNLNEVWSVSVETGEVKRLGPHGGQPFSDLIFSPDGKYVYCAGAFRGATFGLWRLAVNLEAGAPAGEIEKVEGTAGTPIRYLSISADGRRIAYSTQSLVSDIWQLPLSPLTGEPSGEPAPLFADTSRRKTNPAVSPDGRRVAFGVWRLGMPGSVWLVGAAGESPVQLTTDEVGAGVPSWLPDGERVAYITVRDGRPAFYAKNLSTGDERPLVELPEQAGVPRLSPDGRFVAYNSREKGVINVSVQPVGGGAPRLLTSDRESAGFPAWSPDGRWLALELKRGDDMQVAVMPASGGEPVQLTREPGLSWPHSFSPDGDRIAFAGMRDGRWNLYWVSRTTGEQRRLTRFDETNTYVRYPAWSPAGDRIVFERAQVTGNVWLMELK